MGFLDNFTSDTPVEVKQTDYYRMVREAAKAELIENAVNAGVPNPYIKAMITGKQPEKDEIGGFTVVQRIICGIDLSRQKDFTPSEEQERKESEGPKHDNTGSSAEDTE